MKKDRFRKLNRAGIDKFADYIRAGAVGAAPVDLLTNPETSAPLEHVVFPGTAKFDDRHMFGIYLNTLLKEFDAGAISGDSGLWTSLALIWFDRICPMDSHGDRSPQQEYRYILSSDYRHYYRHLVRSPWQLVKDHRENSKFLLIAPRHQKYPLSVHGEILEQFGGRQQVLGSKPIIKAANRLYLDKKTGRPRKGVAGNGRGSARRFGLVLRQLDLTYDPNVMTDESFVAILPKEFEKWKRAILG